jgi:2-phosphoglycerate kinase
MREEITVEFNGVRLSFSSTMLLRSVLKTGIDIFTALDVLKDVTKGIGSKITATELFLKTYSSLEKIAGKKYAERYRLWHIYNVLRRKRKCLSFAVLVGGPPMVGKSTSVTELAFRLNIARVITTDAIRRIVKSIVKERELTVLFYPTFEAWKYVRKENPLSGFIEQARILSKYIGEIARKSVLDRIEVAIEGVHVAPWILKEERSFAEVMENAVCFVIVVDDKDVYKKLVASKLAREGKRFNEELFSTCWKINEYIKEKVKEEEWVRKVRFTTFEGVIEEMIECICEKIREVVEKKRSKALERESEFISI